MEELKNVGMGPTVLSKSVDQAVPTTTGAMIIGSMKIPRRRFRAGGSVSKKRAAANPITSSAAVAMTANSTDRDSDPRRPPSRTIRPKFSKWFHRGRVSYTMLYWVMLSQRV